jgi:TolB protein
VKERRWFVTVMAVLLNGLLALGGSGQAADRVYIDITQPSFERLPIAVPSFKWDNQEASAVSTEAAEALSRALDFSGLFRPLDPRGFLDDPQQMGIALEEIQFPVWRRLGAEFLVRGRCRVTGNGIEMEMRLFDVVASRQVVGKIYEGRREDWREMVYRFADEILLALTGERGVFGTKIAYVQMEGQSKEIYLMDFDGSNPIAVTRDNSVNLSPAWSPDGSQLAYVSYVEGPPKVFAMNLRTGTRRLLFGFPGLNITPAWRPGARELAATLSKDGNPDIFLVSDSGEVLRPLVKTWAIEVSPSWSPQGDRFAYVSNETGNPQIYVADADGGRGRRITFEGNYNTSPSWSPKGDWIAYSSLRDGRHDIFVIRPDGSEFRRLTHGEGDNEAPSWSPDGRMLAFSSTRDGGAPAVWVMLANGESVRRLTRGGGRQELPRWSPRFD